MSSQAAQSRWSYVALLAGAWVVGVAGSGSIGQQLDRNAYDYMFRRYQPAPWTPESVILAIDEPTLGRYGGMPGIRRPLAAALVEVAAALPKAVAVDVVLADRRDPSTDMAMTAALRATPNLVLDSELIENAASWEDPLPEFRACAKALGHVHAFPDVDGVSRAIPLEKFTVPPGPPYQKLPERRWALALEAFRLSRGYPAPLESPSDLEVGPVTIPAARSGESRLMRVRFLPPSSPVPRVSMAALLDDPARARKQLTGKVVFVGVTAQSEVRDRLVTPYFEQGIPMAGVEVHANAFETLAQARFIVDSWYGWVLLFSLATAVLAGAAFLWLPGWAAYSAAVVLLVAAHVTPYVFFTRGYVFSFMTAAATAWLSVLTAAAWQTLVVRRSLRRAESERMRYQQAMHFVTHEMRTPLSAIQGSSELISRYALTEEKRKQIANLINSESKRLARMIEVFLNVEKLSAGQMELKREPISIHDLVAVCAVRTGPLADRKHIRITVEPIPEALHVTGDRELMEYACYNLLTNAVKYSPQQTEVTVSGRRDDGHVRVAVQDQGIGMDQKEVKRIFQKFYRTKKAEESGEAGTGIGLSIVQQIVEQHGGRIDVTSRPGEGSCFTLVLPAIAPAAAPTAAERH